MSEKPEKPESGQPAVPGTVRPGHGADQRRLVAMREEYHQQVMVGPLPPPQLLAEYDRIIPGAAERIVRLAEGEAEHRRSVERELLAVQREDLTRERAERRLGQCLGFVICLAAIIGGTAAILTSSGVAGQIGGGILGVGGLASIVIAFMTGRGKGDTQQDSQHQA